MKGEIIVSVHEHCQGAERTQRIFVWLLVFVRQCADIPLGFFRTKQQNSVRTSLWDFFEQSSKNCNVSNQLEFPFCVLTFLGTLLHYIKFFYFPLNCYQVFFSTQQMGFLKKCTVFMGVKILIFTGLNISKNKPW